ncbi:MAG: DUF1549 domain-containing protein [Verrucomicrobiota bacterium]
MTRFPLTFLIAATLAAVSRPASAGVDFSHQIVPILRKHCADCHTGEKKKGGFSLNDRAALLEGSENGPVVAPGKLEGSKLLEVLLSTDPDVQMPPKGARVTAEETELLKAWITEGLLWEDGFTFSKPSYEPPLHPVRPPLPPVVEGRENPVDRFIDKYLTAHKLTRPEKVEDGAFLRRASLDLIGLLPVAEQTEAFEKNTDPDKRAKLIPWLLGRDADYTEHWLTFWNDHLRNDYSGTGFITGGRSQISQWLYRALVTNMPYDEFARELIAPPKDDSAGFGAGIKWRGEVSAGQTVEIQFSQSISQTFLGINMKCASCHDSFIDRWKLTDAYGLAAIFSDKPMELYRCDKPTGKAAVASWIFPELGNVDAAAPKPQRLTQLAALLTNKENGRFSRTLVNRLWHRLMGRGLVYPPDSMGTPPWDADLLDFLGADFQDHGYDIKRTLALIAGSQAYQMRAATLSRDTDDKGFTFTGPRAKRLTAEQFVDAVWTITGTAPAKADAAIQRGKPDTSGNNGKGAELTGKWIWQSPGKEAPPAGETLVFRRPWKLSGKPLKAAAVITVDNEYILYVNGQRVAEDRNWQTIETVPLTDVLKEGINEILIVGKNAGSGPNLAAVYFEAKATMKDGSQSSLATDTDWQWSTALPDDAGHLPKRLVWVDAAEIKGPWAASKGAEIKAAFATADAGPQPMVRAALMKSDFLMSTLGRPNRDQIVTVRPNDLTTLEAIDLANGPVLSGLMDKGAAHILAKNFATPDACIQWLYQSTLSRQPDTAELGIARESLGGQLTAQGISDLLWMLLMTPEFQYVR